MRLFCVPFAGSGASAFNAWPVAFPDTVELQAVQLPGRESRYGEPPSSDALEVARLVSNAMEPYVDGPYAFFGYSMGALIAFEVIRELRRRGAQMPVQLFVGARRAPQMAATLPPTAHLAHEAFLERIRDQYDAASQLWQKPDLLGIILPVLRADMALCERYVYHDEAPFEFPVQAFAGMRDRSAPLPAVRGWCEQTTGEFALEAFDGGHFFVNAHLARMQQIMISRLESVMQRAASS